VIVKVEKANETRYSKLYKNHEKGSVLEKDGIVVLKYRNCGSLHKGKKCPKSVLPACTSPILKWKLSTIKASLFYLSVSL